MKKCSGFTLIEVLVSVVVLSTGIIFVLHAFETATVALSEMRDTIWASNVAQGELDKLRASGARGDDIGNGFWSGQQSTYYSSFNWERHVSDAGLINSYADGPDIRHVVLKLSREGSSKQFRYETYIRVSEKPEENGGGK